MLAVRGFAILAASHPWLMGPSQPRVPNNPMAHPLPACTRLGLVLL